MKFVRSALLGLVFYSGLSYADCENSKFQVNVGGVCTKIQTYTADKATNAPVLLVALHGDSPFSGPSYQYFFASRLAEQSENLVAVGLLRPGYTDAMNQTSDGVRGQTNGENYNDERVKQVADAIKELKKRHRAHKVIVAGHSGGGAITAKIAAQFPALMDHAFIVSCPCDINAWRKYLFDRRGWNQFKGDIDVSSPIDLVKNIQSSTKITLMVGDADQITPPSLTKEYKKALDKYNEKSELKIISGGHDIFLFPEVTSHLEKIIREYNSLI
ncbi:alpha/beta hydrolase family protein [Pseudoalteromonas luteoviolacea]|uniref:Peptidase S9 prolyl oligopeptidase catalytic domain-containing protein n=1 Tax=Pseudoalteromonas luteoviolacea S4054 TaxID=1129367 RepID=A0A0F6AFC5_9GAMM|nr:alpha/beta hydrolase [Pseudoalteromonas luteoviolacea]AOT08119.1 hypothetical protein S4054249_09800 [Pseudoalteromonas luteoviolacea]AOT13036.1 hypothetical protein S40542_09800 [Pseudoalteromonas luteoviolacea]AOT17948.1 hypothetical protein S4054_09795 [Pseudoalteromonas luteoviolacea]KKE84506.1 hypothetical protein N479_08770 [Pseudoalteromonas luteoviolacea S4054]KZN69520.1 hypothetical protein N481_22270 [Pseudoalteromonas luteoviolacea S4047-1]